MHVQTVEELMTGVTGVDFVQPWYTCVPTSKRNTGMALGGIGSAITATPAGSTPFFHFYNGCGIDNDDKKSIELNNFFYGECVSNDLYLSVRSPSFFRDDILAFPLYDSRGKKYFDGTEPESEWQKIIIKIINSSTFVADNFESLSNWGFIDMEKNGALYHAYDHDNFKLRNYAFLLNIFAFSLTRSVFFTRALISDIKDTTRAFKDCYPSNKILYEFQYPLSITHYKEETQRCTLKKVHITPICPGNQILSSLPLYMTAFHIGNPTNQTMDVTIVLSVENFIGYDLVKTRTGVQDALLHIQRSFKEQTAECFHTDLLDKKIDGLVFRQAESARKGDISGELCFAVMTKDADQILVSKKGNYYSGSESNVVDSGIATGKIFHDIDDAVAFSQKEPLCGAICVSLRLEPGQHKTFEMVTVIDLPNVQLGDYSAQKKYTEFFSDSVYRSRTIAEYFFSHREQIYNNEWVWRETTHQKSVLDAGLMSPGAAGKFRQMLLDNYSFLAESSVWDSNNRFLIRECVDYPFFNSLDVYFYGSFGLLKLFPEIDNLIVREFADSILSEDKTDKLFGSFVRFRDERISRSLKGVRKVLGSTPHDMGTPFDLGANAYSWKDVASWVDLAPKFVLLVYRNFLITRDHSLLHDTWPAINAALDYIRENFIGDEGALPISIGYANTFDNLRGDGVCIYSASLWLASLTVTAEIAALLGDRASETSCRDSLVKGKQQMHDSLWDESGETYLYSILPLRTLHFQSANIDIALKDSLSSVYSLLAELKLSIESELSLPQLIEYLNKFIDQDHLSLPTVAWKQLMPSEPIESLSWKDLSKLQKRSYKKRYIKFRLGECLIADFDQQVIQPECDYIFANQLCADTYLYYLGLPQLSELEQSKKVLRTILEKNMKSCKRRIGASNMVGRDGKDLDSFQAQDVWVGVQYTVAGALAAAGMNEELDMLTETLFEAIYEKAKIPFGIPEGFNCVGLFIAEDFIRLGINDESTRADFMKFLKKKNIISADNRVNFDLIAEQDDFDDIWCDDTNRNSDLLESDEVYELLFATKLKYTAGRYFRAGMIHIVPEILRRHKLILDSQQDQDESYYLTLVSQAKAGSAVAIQQEGLSYAD